MSESISIVIPALNEEDGIAQTLMTLPKEELHQMGYEIQVLVVDNGSTDRTAMLAREAGAEVTHEPSPGYGNALKAGFRESKGHIIITADADASYPLEDAPGLVRMLENENLDFVTTNRFALLDRRAMSLSNRVGNRILTLAMRSMFGLDIQDSQSGMWVFRRQLLDRIRLRSGGMALSEEIKIEACYYCGVRWREVPISYRPRLGEVKLRRWRDGAGNLASLLKKRIAR